MRCICLDCFSYTDYLDKQNGESPINRFTPFNAYGEIRTHLCMFPLHDIYKCWGLNRGGCELASCLSSISIRLMNIIFTNWNIFTNKQSFESRYVGGSYSARQVFYVQPSHGIFLRLPFVWGGVKVIWAHSKTVNP